MIKNTHRIELNRGVILRSYVVAASTWDIAEIEGEKK